MLRKSIYHPSLNIPKITEATKKTSNNNVLLISFDPFSPVIIKKLSKLRKLKQKQKLLSDVTKDDSFISIDLGLKQGGITKVHPLHKAKGKSWRNTKNMAKDINNNSIDVFFLPEYDNKTSADAITKIKGKWTIVDFKYSTSSKAGTISKELKKGFFQAEGVVIKLEKSNKSEFIEAIEELKRKSKELGSMKIINRLGKTIDVSEKDIKSGRYLKKIKSFF